MKTFKWDVNVIKVIKMDVRGGCILALSVLVLFMLVVPAIASPFAKFVWDAHPGRTGESIIFNGSKSFDPDGYAITSYSWDFGDGTGPGTGEVVEHTYNNPGEYNVTLTVINSEGKSDNATKKIVVLTPPIADFTYSVSGDTVTFTDTSSGNIEGWYWEFGDGETSTNQNPTHTYTLGEQDYEVTLVVSDENGLISDATKTVHAGTGSPNQPPVPNFTFSPQNPVVGELITFNGSATDPDADNIIGWLWEFGDGFGSTLQNPTHRYATAGIYMVNLTVVADKGAPGTVSQNITVGTTSNPTTPGTHSGNGGKSPSYSTSTGEVTSSVNATSPGEKSEPTHTAATAPSTTPTTTPTTHIPASSPSASPTPKLPGFEAVYTIIGLIAIVYIVLKRRR